jgi:signal transduction histidine kinase
MPVNKRSDTPTAQGDIYLQFQELNRNYNVNLELLEKSTNHQELLTAILDEYLRRLEELPGIDINAVLRQDKVDCNKEKINSLVMFATQATLLKEKAELYKKLDEKNDKLEQINLELDQKNKQLSALNEHYLNMLSFVSHELRSPLISILGYSELLRDNILGELNKDQKDAVNVIVKVAKNLIDMVKNYLDLSKIETGQMQLTMKSESTNLLEEIIQPVLQTMREQFVKKNMRIIKDLTLDIHINVDKELMKIVLTNIFTNAVNYGQDGTDIICTGCCTDDRFICDIQNFGTGVKAENLNFIFDKFTQVHEIQPKDFRRSSGLGLYISKKIITEHGGKIWAESRHGEWFKVKFDLPIAAISKENLFENNNVISIN